MIALLSIFTGCSPLISNKEWQDFNAGIPIEGLQVIPADPVILDTLTCDFINADQYPILEYYWVLDGYLISEFNNTLDLSKYLIEETTNINCGVWGTNIEEQESESVRARLPDCSDFADNPDISAGYCNDDWLAGSISLNLIQQSESIDIEAYSNSAEDCSMSNQIVYTRLAINKRYFSAIPITLVQGEGESPCEGIYNYSNDQFSREFAVYSGDAIQVSNLFNGNYAVSNLIEYY